MNNKPTFTFNPSSTPLQAQVPQSSQQVPLSQVSPPSSLPFGVVTNPPASNKPGVFNQPLPPQQQAPYVQSIGQQNAFSGSYGLAQNIPSSNPFYSPPQVYKNNVQVNKPSNVYRVPPISSTYDNYPPPQPFVVSSNIYPPQQIQYENFPPSLFQNNIGINMGPNQTASIRLLNKK